MEYTSVNSIQSYYMDISFDSTSYISGSDVISFINQTEAEVKIVLGKRYTLPLTNAMDILLAKSIVEKMVVGIVDGIIREKDSEGKFEFKRNPIKEARELLEKIEKGDLILNSTEKPSSIKFNNLNSDGEAVEKYFTEKQSNPKNWS